MGQKDIRLFSVTTSKQDALISVAHTTNTPYVQHYYTIMTIKDKKANTDFFDYKLAPFLGNLVTIAKTIAKTSLTFSLRIYLNVTQVIQVHNQTNGRIIIMNNREFVESLQSNKFVLRGIVPRSLLTNHNENTLFMEDRVNNFYFIWHIKNLSSLSLTSC